MPWCEPCAKYHSPSAMTSDGRCPDCNTAMSVADAHGKITSSNLNLKELAGKNADEKLPWHFKLLVGMLVIYLSWRVVQLFL